MNEKNSDEKQVNEGLNLNRRKVLEIATAGLAGMLLAQNVNGQSEWKVCKI